MAIIPEYFAQQGIAVSNRPRAGQGLIPSGTNVISEAIAGAVQQVGKVATDAAYIEANKQAIRDNITLAELRGRLDDFEFESAPDPSKWQFIEDSEKGKVDYLKRWESKAKTLPFGQSRAVQEQFGIYTDLHRNKAKRIYQSKSRPMEQEWVMEDLQRQWATILKANPGRPDIQKMKIEHTIESYSGYLTPATKKSLRADADKNIALFNKQIQLDGLHLTAQQMPFDEAITMLNNIKGLSSAERNDLIRRRERQQEIATATKDTGVYWDTLRKLTNDPDSMTEAQIAALVKPNSLTTDDYKEFMGLKEDESSPLKTAGAQLYMGVLDAMYPGVLKPTEETSLDEIQEYDIKNNQLRTWIEKNPDATPEQRRKYFDELIGPKVTTWLERLFSGNMGTGAAPNFGGGFPATKPKKEETTEKKTLTSDIAAQYLNLAGGDRSKAEQLAKDDGYVW